MKIKLYSRADNSTVKKTIELFREEAASERKIIRLFSVLIPTRDFLYLVLLPLLISFIVQSLIEHPHDTTTPLWLIAAMIVTGILSTLIQRLAFTTFFNHEERITTKLAKRAMDGLLSHGYFFFSNQKVGSLAGDVNTFSRAYLALMDILFLQASPIIVSFVASLAVIALIAPLLVIPLLLLTAFIIGESILSLQKRSIHRIKRKEMQSKLFGTIADILGNQTLVRMFGQQSSEVKRVVDERKAIEKVAAAEIDMIQQSTEIRTVGLYAFQTLTMAIAVYFIAHDMISIAALVFTVSYLGRVTGAMFNINSIIRTSEQAFLDAAKVTEILDTVPEVRDIPHAKNLDVNDASIQFNNVSFSYEDAKEAIVFKKLNLQITTGQSVGLVGKSGGGKSTLTHLLLRYMDISDGEIMIDGQNIADITQDSLRSNIAYVPQDPFLFHRTLRENIIYGRPNATDAEILGAARAAHAYEFIEQLPKGLDTIVGERGVKLSGGQRQRIAIARAILKDAPILVLDEATSALDSESEVYIQKALTELMKNRTSIVIAHRLSTIARLDRIIVLDKGKIVEDGSHAELLAQNGTYAKLWKHQSGGFIEE